MSNGVRSPPRMSAAARLQMRKLLLVCSSSNLLTTTIVNVFPTRARTDQRIRTTKYVIINTDVGDKTWVKAWPLQLSCEELFVPKLVQFSDIVEMFGATETFVEFSKLVIIEARVPVSSGPMVDCAVPAIETTD